MVNKLTTVIVSDTHVGHDVGLMSDTARDSTGRSVELNKYQEPLWDKWKEIAKKYHNPDCLLLNGDLCDLLNIHRQEPEVWTSDSLTIRNETVKLINMFGKPKKTYVIKGTPAHVTVEHVKLEEEIAQDLDSAIYQNRRVYPYRLINLAPLDGVKQIYHVTHHMSATSIWQYRGTAPSKAMASLMLNETSFIKKSDKQKIIGIIRSHVHHYWYEESTSRRMIVNPCWQAQTNFMIQKMPENRPDIGSVILTHHKDGTFDKVIELVPSEKQRPPIFEAGK